MLTFTRSQPNGAPLPRPSTLPCGVTDARWRLPRDGGWRLWLLSQPYWALCCYFTCAASRESAKEGRNLKARQEGLAKRDWIRKAEAIRRRELSRLDSFFNALAGGRTGKFSRYLCVVHLAA